MRPAATRLARATAAAPWIWLAAAAPVTAGVLGQANPPDLFWWRWVAALALCMALAVGGALALRARMPGGKARPIGSGALAGLFARTLGGGAGPRRLRVVETARVNPQLEVSIVRCDDREYVLATTPQGAVLLSQAPALETGGAGP
jgi:hypothetical protein